MTRSRKDENFKPAPRSATEWYGQAEPHEFRPRTLCPSASYQQALTEAAAEFAAIRPIDPKDLLWGKNTTRLWRPFFHVDERDSLHYILECDSTGCPKPRDSRLARRQDDKLAEGFRMCSLEEEP